MNVLNILPNDLIQNVLNLYLDYFTTFPIIQRLVSDLLILNPDCHIYTEETYYIETKTLMSKYVYIDYIFIIYSEEYDTTEFLTNTTEFDFKNKLLYIKTFYSYSQYVRSIHIINVHSYDIDSPANTVEYNKYFLGGTIQYKYIYKSDKKIGFFHIYNQNGDIITNYTFKNIQVYDFIFQPGYSYEYNIYKDLKCDGTHISHFNVLINTYEGLIINYKNGEKEGKSYTFEKKIYPSYITEYVCELNYVNGVLNGPLYNYKNGKLISIKKYVNGLLNGQSYKYNNGKLISIENYTDNLLNGPSYTYNNGKLSSIQNYTENLLNGVYEEYIDGKLFKSGFYINGLLNGKLYTYNLNKNIFNRSQFLSIKEYSNGNIINLKN